jgi:hypothetical protein
MPRNGAQEPRSFLAEFNAQAEATLNNALGANTPRAAMPGAGGGDNGALLHQLNAQNANLQSAYNKLSHTAAAKISELELDRNKMSMELETVSGKYDDEVEAREAAQTTLGEVQKQLTEIGTKHADEVTKLTQAKNEAETSVTKLTTDNADLKAKVEKLEKDNTELTEKVTRLEGENTELTEKVTKLGASASGLPPGGPGTAAAPAAAAGAATTTPAPAAAVAAGATSTQVGDNTPPVVQLTAEQIAANVAAGGDPAKAEEMRLKMVVSDFRKRQSQVQAMGTTKLRQEFNKWRAENDADVMKGLALGY